MKPIVEIAGRAIGPGHAPYLIAEMACAHDGDLQEALDLCTAASEAGADAIQLQFFRAELTLTPRHPAFELVKSIELDGDQWGTVVEHSRKLGIHVLVCTYDAPSVDLAAALKVDGIKLNSSDLCNPEVLRAVGATGIPFTLGTGASTMDEIRAGLAVLDEAGGDQAILMHGVQNFPTRIEDLNIQRLGLLLDVFGLPVGYHDHTDAEDPFAQSVDLVALGLGAQVLEKHITMDRSKKGTDHQAALEPKEWCAYVERIRKGWTARGSRSLRAFTESDLKYRKFQKKSIVASRDLEAGHVLDRKDILYIRNDVPGVAPVEADRFLGATLQVNISKYDNLLTEHFDASVEGTA